MAVRTGAGTSQLLWTKKGTVVPKCQRSQKKRLLPSYLIYAWLLQGNLAGAGLLGRHLFSLYSPSKGVRCVVAGEGEALNACEVRWKEGSRLTRLTLLHP